MPVETQPVEQQDIDQAAFIQKRNEDQQAKLDSKVTPARIEAKSEPKTEITKAEEVAPTDDKKNLIRSLRRASRQALEEAAELRGKLAVYQELGIKPPGSVSRETVDVDAEPKREDFEDDGKYMRALGRWEGRQGAKEVVSHAEESTKAADEQARMQSHFKAMDEKAMEDMKLIPDFKEVSEVADKAAEEDPSLQFSDATQPVFMGLLAASDVRAFMLHHFCKSPEDTKRILGLADINQMPQRKDYKSGYDFNLALGRWAGPQIEAFRRLEGRVEKMYTPEEKKEVAETSVEKSPPKDRTHPAEAKAGRNTDERDAHKPRPSREVEARGGSATPDQPVPGTAAWFAWRNQITGGR